MARQLRVGLRRVWLQVRPVLLAGLPVILWCEWLLYYWTMWACRWPVNGSGEDGALRAMVVADTHLLGPFRGHWFDKLRREWQMHRGFVTARWYLDPDVYFILGDLFDEGQWCSLEQLEAYKSRLRSLFLVPDDRPFFTVVGNHDIGFHYAMHPSRVSWFERQLAAEPVRMVEIRGSYFVLLNSIAMEGDRCRLCAAAERAVEKLNTTLDCLRLGVATCDGYSAPYSRPILMQHFPLYRRSDEDCTNDSVDLDSMPADVRRTSLRERWDCLSESSTRLLLSKLQPRAVFGGHTHFGCRMQWDVGGGVINEWTVGSFSWRNTPQPTILLLSITATDLSVSKCYLPAEPNVLTIYGLYAAGAALYFAYCLAGALAVRSSNVAVQKGH